jgi:hypothetical protein
MRDGDGRGRCRQTNRSASAREHGPPRRVRQTTRPSFGFTRTQHRGGSMSQPFDNRSQSSLHLARVIACFCDGPSPGPLRSRYLHTGQCPSHRLSPGRSAVPRHTQIDTHG